MAAFKYKAVGPDGKRVEGTREAENRDEVALYLHQQGLITISIQDQISFNFNKILKTQIGGVPLKERIIFVKQLSTMLSAGLPILQALQILVQQTRNESLKEKLSNVYKNIQSGGTLSSAFAKDRSMFNEVQLNLIIAGEKSGNLNEILLKIAVDLEKSNKLRGKIVGAMIYPAVILVVMVVVVAAMLIFMIPAVEDLYKSFGQEDLPGVTGILVGLSHLATNPVFLISFTLIVVSLILGVRYYYSTFSGRRRIDRLILKVPVFGNVLTNMQLAQFSRVTSLLLSNGVPIVETLKIVANSMSNSVYQDVIMHTMEEVTKGSNIAIPISSGDVFPIVMQKMIATGEQTGQLDKVMGDMGTYYENEVDDATENLTKLLEPFMLLIVGGLVGFIAVAIYLPLYSLGQSIS